METVIDSFRGQYNFLSNFSDCGITYDGITYRNSEAAFQAQKTLDINERRSFANLNPSDAKYRGRNVKLRYDWDSIKDSVMLDILRAKFAQNPGFSRMLIDTGSAYLCEGNTWGDTYWGMCKGKGQNKLGKLLMLVRDEIRSKHE